MPGFRDCGDGSLVKDLSLHSQHLHKYQMDAATPCNSSLGRGQGRGSHSKLRCVTQAVSLSSGFDGEVLSPKSKMKS